MRKILSFEKLCGFKGLMVLKAVVSRKDVWGNTKVERVFEEVDENKGCTIVNTPGASRDWTMPTFFEKDGKQYLDACSYRLRSAEDLLAYTGQPFGDDRSEAALYKIVDPIEKEPDVPEGRRFIIYDVRGSILWDSLMGMKFSPASEGFVSMK